MHALPRGLPLALLLGACGSPVEDPEPPDTSNPCGAFQLVGELPAALLSVWGTHPDDVYAVGADDGSGPQVFHFDGARWERLPAGGRGDLWWVWGDGQRVWMVGAGGRILRYDPSDGTFTEDVLGDGTLSLFGVWGPSPDQVYVVAADVRGDRPGEVHRWDGASWELVHTLAPAPNGTLRQPFKVWGTGPEDVWVVGTSALIAHFDGASWDDAIVAPIHPTTTLFTAHGAGGEVFAVGGQGNGMVARFHEGGWTNDSPPPSAVPPGFTGVFVDEALGPVVAGDHGSIWLRSEDGWAADCRTPATVWDFHAVWVDPAGGIWSVGGDLLNLDRGVLAYGGDRALPSLDL